MSHKQQRFVSEYLKSLNATDAARKAGYKNPNQASTKLMSNKQVATAIAHVTKDLTRRLEFSAEDVLDRLWYAMNFNPLRWFTPSPNGKWMCDDPSKLPDEVGRMIKAMRIQKIELENQTLINYEIILCPHGTELLEVAMKHKGLFPKEIQNTLHQHLHVNYDQLSGAPPQLEDRVLKAIDGPQGS